MRLLVLSALALATPAPALAQDVRLAAPASDVQVVASAQQVLDEVNAARAARGLPPYLLDENLAKAATACAIYRARHGMDGHTSNDFGFLPPGTVARSAGCAAWPVGMGWGSCCTYDHYQFAGAGYCVGPDGRRYMQLFVR
jgi:uncharacterized protein YkwD